MVCLPTLCDVCWRTGNRTSGLERKNGLNHFRDEKVRTLTSREGLISDDVDALAAGLDGSIWVVYQSETS